MIFAAAVLQNLLQIRCSLDQQYFPYLVRRSQLQFSEVTFHLRSYLFKVFVLFNFLYKTCPPLTTFEFRNVNLNSLRNQFEYLAERIKNMSDVSLVSECKLVLYFPDTRFQTANYNWYVLERLKQKWQWSALCKSRFKL